MTPKERLLVYELTLTSFKNSSYGPYLCIVTALNALRIGLSKTGMVEVDFPELYTQKPPDRNNRYIWWPQDDYKSREQALRNAIELTKKLIGNE